MAPSPGFDPFRDPDLERRLPGRANMELATLVRGGPKSVVTIEAPESGTLPGEEQVTTMDTLRALSPAEQAAIQKRYEASGWSKDTPYEDFVGELFSEIPPGERLVAMRKYASQAPRIYIGSNPNAVPGKNTALANARIAAGKPLPEGRNPEQYTEDQRRTMQRNVFAPERPMTQFGGTFIYRPDGSVSQRAPDPAHLDVARQIANDPTQGPGSASHVAALAQAYGLEVQQYGNDLDVLASDTAAEHIRHERAGRWLDTVPNEMGGFRYAPNPEKAAQALAAQDRQASPRDRALFMSRIMQRYQRVMTPEDIAALQSYVADPSGYTKMRDLATKLHGLKTLRIASNVADRAANWNLTRDMNNPAVARGMLVRSLINEVRNGDPAGMAAVYSGFGDQHGSDNAFRLSAVQRQADASVAAARAEAEAKQTPPTADGDQTMAAQFAPQITDAMQLPPGQRDAVLATIYRRMKIPEEQIPIAVHEAVLDHEAINNPNGDAVQSHLMSLVNNEAAFKEFITRRMKRTREEANAMWDRAHPPSDPVQAGRDAVRSVAGKVRNIQDTVRGVAQGVAEEAMGQ